MKCLVRDGPDRDDERKREGERTLLGGNKYAHTHAYLIVGRRRRRRRPVVVSRRNGNSKRKGKFISFHFIFTSLGRIKSNRNRRRSCATGRRASERNSIVVFGVNDDAFVRRLRRLGTETVERKGGKSSTESHRVNRHLLVGWTIDCIELDFVSS